jgi:hypothetical protein
LDQTAAPTNLAPTRAKPLGVALPRTFARFNPGLALKIGIVIALGMVEAWAGPPDRNLDFLTHGSAPARAIMVAILALIGLAIASKSGLSLDFTNTKRPFAVAMILSIGVATFCAATDFLFRPILNHSYIEMSTTTPIGGRQIMYSMRVIYESLTYRLFLGSAFVWIIGLVWRSRNGQIAEGAYVLGFTIAQLLNMTSMASFMPMNGLTLTYYAFRFLAPGVAWGLIFRRYGFLTNELSVGAVHFFLQPMLTGILLLQA